MTSIVIQSRVSADGVLTLAIPVGPDNANRDVKVTISAIDQSRPARPLTQSEWEQFIRETAGSIDDPTFVRPEQG